MSKYRFSLVVVIFLFVLGCSNSKDGSRNPAPSENNFKSYFDTLRLIKTPVKISWAYWDSAVQRHMDSYGPIKSSILDNPLARVFDEKNYKVIIFVSSDESGSPALITVDRNENPIDTVYLLGDISSNSPERRTIELAEISAGQTIHLIDTVSQWKLTNDGVRIPDTKQITIEEKKYIISESGKFTEIK